MKVNYNLIRIGKIRKSLIAEIKLKQNVESLKYKVRSCLSEIVNVNKKDEIDLIMIIPEKGYKIKILVRDLKYPKLKRKLTESFPTEIFNGEYSTLMENIDNRIF